MVLADATVKAARPQDWAGAAIALFHRLEADCIVAEVNQGGDMVTAVIKRRRPVRAGARGAGQPGQVDQRAEPVATLYQQGKVRHAGRFPALEDEMCEFGVGRTFRRALSRPRRRAGLGGDRADAGRHGASRRSGISGELSIALRPASSGQIIMHCGNGPGRWRPGREGAPERKAGWPGGFVALHLQAEAAWTRRDYATLAQRGLHEEPGRAPLGAADRRDGRRRAVAAL